jgi:carbon storage regulator
MLVLSRKRDEEIMIGKTVKIMVVDIRGDKVRLGTQAPADLEVHRGEVWLKRLEQIAAQRHTSVDELREEFQRGELNPLFFYGPDPRNLPPGLVLSRQRDEVINIGGQVSIVVVDICGDKVRLGIEAPKELQLHRLEVFNAIERGNALTG